jgi:multicomponent Na+:H+ antiporter subunit D
MLTPIGMAMIVIGLAYAVAEDDVRRAAASGLAANAGICVLLIGVGSPLSLAAAEGHAFATIFAFLAYQLVLGGVLGRMGFARVSQFENLSRLMPITALLLAAAGLAVAAVPGFALYATGAIALEATAQWELEWAWALMACAPPALLVALMLRPTLAAYRGAGKAARLNEAPFPMLLGAALSVFFCFSVGIAPYWLYGLLPAAPAFDPFSLERVAPHLELLGAAGVAYVLLRAVKLAPPERPARVFDIDSFYRGPAASAGRWLGVVMLRFYGAWQSGLAQGANQLGTQLGRWARSCDRPYRRRAAGLAQFAALLACVAVALFWRQT